MSSQVVAETLGTKDLPTPSLDCEQVALTLEVPSLVRPLQAKPATIADRHGNHFSPSERRDPSWVCSNFPSLPFNN